MLAQNSCLYVPLVYKYYKKVPQVCYQCLKLLSTQAKEQSLSNEGPLSLYTQRVSSGELSKDSHQEEIIQHLQQVYHELTSFERPALQSQSGRSLFSLFKKPQPQKIIAPKGLYLYGSVGGGKTMLMDLFYDTVPVNFGIFSHLFMTAET